MWWSNSEQRKQQKEIIKNIIKRTQLSKKTAQTQPVPLTSSPPPALSHSVPTSAEVPFAESFPQQRYSPEGSPYSDGCDFQHNAAAGYFPMQPPAQPFVGAHTQYPMFSPYEVDIKTERQIFVNDVPTRKDSTISTFSTFQPPPMGNGLTSFPADSWVQQEHFESTSEAFTEEPVDFNFFEFPHEPLTPDHETVITVDDNDKYLLNHFIDKVCKLIFPILEANQHGSARSDVILPALESNKAYLHCCLSTAATHMKATENLAGEQINNDIVRHRYDAISALCEALKADTNHAQILEATLGMIFFQCSVGRPDEGLPDIPWYQHFGAAVNLVNKLDLPATATAAALASTSPPFNMTLTAWIDILGATLRGQNPTFADTYRELHLAGRGIGLAALMGCEDKVMFLISEIACLDVQREEGLHEVSLCKYVEYLAREIGASENPAEPVASCFSTTGAIRPRQLTLNLTAVFRIAARIYLCTLVPGYYPAQPSMCHLVAQFTEAMNFIPAGPDGFDRSLAWPLLVAGASSVAGSPFRAMLDERGARLGDAARFGSFGRVRELLKDIWTANDAQGGYQGVRWRDAMKQKGWEHLLI